MRSEFRLQHVFRIMRFALVSGTGLAIDIVVFIGLIAGGTSAFLGNALSSAMAVTFVYYAALRGVFRYDGRANVQMLLAYILYQIGGIIMSSWAVSALITHQLSPAISKVLILPVTFGANYLFMLWLTSHAGRWLRDR